MPNVRQHQLLGSGCVPRFQCRHNGCMVGTRLHCVVLRLVQRGRQRGAGGQVAQHITQQAVAHLLGQANMEVGQQERTGGRVGPVDGVLFVRNVVAQGANHLGQRAARFGQDACLDNTPCGEGITRDTGRG